MKTFAILGAIGGLVSVTLGAFGAHALKSTLSSDMLETFETGVRYQMYHSLALLAVVWALVRTESAIFGASGWCFVAGIVLFSGSLYLLAFTGIKWFGAITPIGGLAFLAGWGLMAYGFWKNL